MTMAMRGAGYSQHRVLLVSGNDVVLSHNHTDTGPAIGIIAALCLDHEITHAYISGTELFPVLSELNRVMQDSVSGWRMRITNRRRYAFSRDRRRVVTGRFFVDYFCIDRKADRETRLPRKRFDVINLDLLREKPPRDHTEQLEMTLALLEMCDNRGVRMRGTRGALGSAMLRKSPYWEKGRRAAPKFINDMARPYLPGNFYALSSKVTSGFADKFIPHCYYVDQTSAHHSIVRDIPLPLPGALHARGSRDYQKPWAYPDSPIGRELLHGKHVGLVLARVTIAPHGPTLSHLYPPWAKDRGTRLVWLWTPELRLLEDHRLQLEYFISSFTATTYDMALREYAGWALSELQGNAQRASYKKGSLLAAYGMLAFNGAGRSIYRYWGGVSNKPICEIPRAGLVAESKINLPEHLQLSTVNVVARGVIESETRTRSIEYARELHSQGFHVPQIYADGVLVETNQLPFIPEGWRVSHSLTNVHLPRSNAIVSDQVVKLPGVAGDEQDREWERTREESQRVLAA